MFLQGSVNVINMIFVTCSEIQCFIFIYSWLPLSDLYYMLTDLFDK